MKKWIGICSFLLALCFVFSALAAPGDNMLFFRDPNADTSENIDSMAATSKGIYLLKSTLSDYNIYQLAFYDYQTQETTVLLDALPQPYYVDEEEFNRNGKGNFKDMISELFVDGDTLYAINVPAGEVYQIAVENNTATKSLAGKVDPKVFISEQDDYKYMRQIWGLVMEEGKLYVSYYDYENQENPMAFLRCDLEKGTYESVAKLSLMEMVPYKQGQVLGLVYDPYHSWDEVNEKALPREIHAIDLATGKTTLIYSSETTFAGLQYDKATDNIYFAQGNQVLRLGADGKTEKVAYLPSSDTYNCTGSAYSNGLYTFCNYNGMSIRNTDPQYLPSTVLTVYGGYSGDTEVAFLKNNPEIAFNFPESYISTVEQMAQAISNDKELDIVQTGANYMDFDALIKKGYCADLSGYPELVALVETMYPYLKDYIMRDGKLYAIPLYASASGYAYSSSVLKDVDMSTDDLPTNFQELCQFITDWNDDLSYDYPDYVPMYYQDIRRNTFNDMFRNYCMYYEATNQELTFMTPLFKSLLASFDGMKTDNIDKEGMSEDEMWSRRNILDNYGQVVDFSSLKPTDPESNYYIPWTINLSSDIPSYYETYVTLAFVSPGSKNIDAAAKYLTYTLENMNLYYKPYIFSNMEGNIESRYFERMLKYWQEDIDRIKKLMETADESEKKEYEEQLKYYEESLANQDRYRYEITQAALDYFKENVADKCVLSSSNPLYGENSGEITPIIDRYLAKTINADQMISELDKKIKMIQRESK